jgi:hypothetical protein
MAFFWRGTWMMSLIRREVWTVSFIAVCYSTWLTPAHAELSPPLSSREIAATGDEIRGFGRIGFASITVDGIDSEGRVLFGAHLSDGRLGLFLGDGKRVEQIWTSTPDGPNLQLHAAKMNESGRILVPAFDPLRSLPTDLFEVRRDGVYRVIGPGDLTDEGDVVCRINDFATNGSGATVVDAFVGLSADACAAFDGFGGIYLLDDGVPRRIFRADDFNFARLFGMTDDGFVVLASYGFSETTLIATDGIEVRHLFETALDRSLYDVAVNAAGQAVFTIFDDGTFFLYSATDEGVRQITSSLDNTPDGNPIILIGDPKIDSLGNVFAVVEWSTPDGMGTPASFGIIRYSSEGEATLIGPQGYQPEVNHAGQIAALQKSDAGAPNVVRWTDEDRALIVKGTEEAPGGGWYASAGIISSCLSDDGRIAFVANSFDSGEGLLCADATGVHETVGGKESMAGQFNSFLGCAFSQDQLIFVATEGDRSGSFESIIYRADSKGRTRLIGPGDSISNGGSIVSLEDAGSFATNDRGSIVVLATTDGGEQILRFREGGGLEAVHLDEVGFPTRVPGRLGIAEDDTVVALVDTPGDDPTTALVAADGESARVLARTGDPTLPAGPLDVFGNLIVQGDLAWFTAIDPRGLWHVLQYDLSESRLRDVHLPGLQEGCILVSCPSAPAAAFFIKPRHTHRHTPQCGGWSTRTE